MLKDTVDKLRSPTSLALLESLGEMMAVDISQIEARHASNREASLMRSRGWVPSLMFLCAAFVCRTAARMRESFNQCLGRAQDPAESPNAGGAPRRRRRRPRRGGGGAWRAFIHEKCRGSRFDVLTISRLAAEYHALSAHEKERYTRAGLAATRAHSMGFDAFGRQTEQARRVAQQSRALPPGSVLASGAIVALDAQPGLQLALNYDGADSFANQYEQALDELKQRSVQDVLALTPAEGEAMRSTANEAKNEPLGRETVDRGHSQIADCFLKARANLQALVMLRWLPPLPPLLKACALQLGYSRTGHDIAV